MLKRKCELIYFCFVRTDFNRIRLTQVSIFMFATFSALPICGWKTQRITTNRKSDKFTFIMAKWPCSFILLVCIFTGHFITVFLSHDFDSKNITSDRMDGIVQCQFNISICDIEALFSPCCLSLDYGSTMAGMEKKQLFSAKN